VDQDFVQKLHHLVQQRVAANTLPLPALRLAVVECQALLNDENFSYRTAVGIIEQDAGLAARVLGVANSAVYAGLSGARTLLQAVKRLGAHGLRSVLFEASLHELFEPEDPKIRDACAGLWAHSKAVAVVARETAHVVMRDLDECYLAGLLHDVGKPIIASLLVNAKPLGVETSRIDAETWIEAVQVSHRLAGSALAKRWKLPEAGVNAILQSAQYDESDARCVSNCVRFGNSLAKAEGIYVGAVDAADNDAILRAGQKLLGIAVEDVDRMRSLLTVQTSGVHGADRDVGRAVAGTGIRNERRR
jgi:putative nucleotidyltransferase with HDIG domain